MINLMKNFHFYYYYFFKCLISYLIFIKRFFLIEELIQRSFINLFYNYYLFIFQRDDKEL